MSYRYVYPNGAAAVAAAPSNGYTVDHGLMSAGYPNGMAAPMYDDHRRQSYSPGSFSSDSEVTDDYEYRGRMITRETRCPRDVVRAPTPPPIIKRVVERAPTPEAPVMERVIIRPQAQEIVERVIEQPRTPPPRIIQKEMQEEAPPPIVRTRVIKVDRPVRNVYCQQEPTFTQGYAALPSCSNGAIGGNNPYRTHSVLASIGRPTGYHTAVDNNPSFSSASSFEFNPPMQMPQAVAQAPLMMMPMSQQAQPFGVMQQAQHVPPMGVFQQQQPVQPIGVMQQPSAQQPMMFRPVQMQPSMPSMGAQSAPPLPSNFIPQPAMYPPHQGMSYGYRPMLQQGRPIPAGMPMMMPGNIAAPTSNSFPSQPPVFNPMAQHFQQVVY